MSKTFTADQFRWLDQVLADRSLENLAFKIAFAISKQTDSRIGSIATCGHKELSYICGCSIEGVRKALRQLIEAQHLHVIQTGDGRSRLTQYSWILDGSIYAKGVTTVTPFRASDGSKGVTTVTPLGRERCYPSTGKVLLGLEKGVTGVTPPLYVSSRSSRSSTQPAPRPRVFVEVETPEWQAWLAHGHKADLKTGHPQSKSVEGWWFPSQWPPGDNVHTLPSQRGNR